MIDPVITSDVAAILATEASVAAAKKKLTSLLTVYVQEFNEQAPRAALATALTAYVNQFNVLTALTNTLWTQVAQLDADANPPIVITAQTMIVSPVMPKAPRFSIK